MQNNKPIAYASRVLTQTKMRYAEIEKKLLAVVFACTKFNDYIYGKPVTIETDPNNQTCDTQHSCSTPTNVASAPMIQHHHSLQKKESTCT